MTADHQRLDRTLRIIRGAMIVFGVMNVLALGLSYKTVEDLKQVQRDQQDGRRAAVGATCAINAAIIDAARETILARDSKPGQSEGERILREGVADTYSTRIALEVERETGQRGLVKPDGSLDCRRLRKIGRVG